MDNKRLHANMLLLLTAAIWGFAFVAQRVGSQYIGAFTFNGIRFALGSISLIPLIIYLDKRKKNNSSNESNIEVTAKKINFTWSIGWNNFLRRFNPSANWSYLYNCWKSKLYYWTLYGYCTDNWNSFRT